MTLRCLSRTSSYLRMSLRCSALRPSTVFCARSIALVTMRRLDRHVVWEGAAHHPLHGTGGEQPHQLVFERQEETALAEVTLPARATT